MVEETQTAKQQFLKISIPGNHRPAAGQKEMSWNTKGETQEIVAGTLNQTKHPHGFFMNVHLAFADERPLQLSPDMIQLCIVQLITKHIRSNPKLYGSQLGAKLNANGEIEKVKLIVRNDSLVLGEQVSLATPKWATVFPVFCSLIQQTLTKSEVVNALLTEFTTTTHEQRVVNAIALMDAMQDFFSYEVHTKCGIPEIQVLGTKADWVKLQQSLAAYNKPLQLEWWTEPVSMVLQHVIDAFDTSKSPDLSFWSSIYKFRSGSGSTYANGWSLLFSPHVLDGRDGKTTVCDKTKWATHDYVRPIRDMQGIGTGMSSVDFVWDYLGTRFPMTLSGGFLPAKLEPAITTRVGWNVTENKPSTNARKKK